ncbi:ATP-dependent DNA helicase [Salinifilum aidingensis]
MRRTAPLLVRTPHARAAGPGGAAAREPAARRVLDHAEGPLRVLGGPGTGKSTLAARAAADRVTRAGVSPENVLVLTASRSSAEWMRGEITRVLTEAGTRPRTTPEPLARSVHSYAFAVLRNRAVRAEQAPPKLLTGAEEDHRIRELLREHIDQGAAVWPESLRPALGVPGFAVELRDFLLRATERGIGEHRLVELGEQRGCPEWTAVGRFGAEYREIARLRERTGNQPPEYDAAELIGAALAAFDQDPELLAEERRRVRYVVVDDAQHLDEQQYELVRRLRETAAETLLFGDPDQAVYSFRGAEPELIKSDEVPTEVLATDHRMAPAVRTAVGRLAARMSGSGPQRQLTAPQETPASETAAQGTADSGTVRVRLLATEAQQAAWVADQLRRAHLQRGVPWSEMAVVVRSLGHTLPVLRRALVAAGVPVNVPSDDVPLSQRGAVRPFLRLLRCAARPDALDADTAEELLSSVLGGADPLALRRLRRGLRRLELAAGGSRPSGELLVEVLQDTDRLVGLPDAAAAPARRLARLLHEARESVTAGARVEEVLWRAWRASGLQDAWLEDTERGGVAGAQANRDLDAVVELFDEARGFDERWSGQDAAAFADELDAQHIARDSRAPAAPRDDAVQVLTAHRAAGREWTVVAVPGVQEGVWPNLRQRGSLLGIERLLDTFRGDEGAVSMTAPLLAEERRLLFVAASRARSRLLVSAVRGEEEQPSRFLDELDGTDAEDEVEPRPVTPPQRGLSAGELVGELRRAVCDPESDPDRRERAATQLARLARAGVPGADPGSWYGLAEVSSHDAPVGEDEPVRVSPSTVELLRQCPLRWLLERHGGQDGAELAAVTGTLVHEVARLAAEGRDPEELRRALDEAWKSVDAGAPWFSRKERERVAGMVEAFLRWMAETRGELTQRGVEHDLDLQLPPRSDGGPWLQLRGRVDRLETDASGQEVIVDIKTGKSPISKNDAEQHPQLAVYQLAAALGAFRAEEGGAAPGGARLLYVAKPDRAGVATERVQSGLDDEQVHRWLDEVHAAAESSTGPGYVAYESSDCSRCPVRASCPLQGRQVAE